MKKTNQNDRIGKIIRNIFLKFVGMTKLKKKYIDNGDFGIGEDINTKSVNDKSKIPDVAHDRKALSLALKNLTQKSRQRLKITQSEVIKQYFKELLCVLYFNLESIVSKNYSVHLVCMR